MNSYKVDINPKEYTVVNIASSVELRVSNLIIGSSVDIMVLVKGPNENVFKVERFHIEGEEYNNWGSDDQYLVNLVLSKIGLTQKNE